MCSDVIAPGFNGQQIHRNVCACACCPGVNENRPCGVGTHISYRVVISLLYH